ncbi:MAG: UDP-N-acetylmuramate--alanine ligase [Actinomycetota bacterium]|jgi:UDP-N-acetylmuramate--alanine ligase|nr:UDP-N-acetylmuramate--alanine ligase [Actinomycetota bacterium]
MKLTEARRVHFIGIGGAGMSAIAKVLIERGTEVSGSDLKRSRAATMLEMMGARVYLGHDASNIGDAEVVVASAAIPDRNPELAEAHLQGLRVIYRGQALAEVLSGTRSVVVAGTHGKTTTTSMIVSILVNAGIDPTYLVGGGLNDSGTNARSGSSDLSVAESDESDGSFLLLQPTVAVVTNVEVDHVDHWGSMDELRAAFARFVSSVPSDGAAVVPATDAELAAAGRAQSANVITFGDEGDVSARDVRSDRGGSTFTLHTATDPVEVSLRVPGLHNVENALAAAAAVIAVGLSPDEAAQGLGRFRGVERRFELKGSARGVTVIDDYAHHPTEVAATLSAARTGGWERIVAVFQPHRYSRTIAFSSDFGDSFRDADRIVLTDVYGAGEEPVPGVTGKLVADAVCRSFPGRPVAYLPHRAELITYLAAMTRPGDALLTLGAGDVSSVGEELLKRLEVAG